MSTVGECQKSRDIGRWESEKAQTPNDPTQGTSGGARHRSARIFSGEQVERPGPKFRGGCTHQLPRQTDFVQNLFGGGWGWCKLSFKPVLFPERLRSLFFVRGRPSSRGILGPAGPNRFTAANSSGTGRDHDTRVHSNFARPGPVAPLKNLYVSITRKRGARARGRAG